MAKTKQMMETDERGVKYQFFPITHAGAVLGLKEFLEGDFFQADFDRVMALLEERSDKAFAEIDEKSDAMVKHADEKIAEFDNKIVVTNQTLATLEKEIYDTQQTFENMDVFNKQESSANVVYQLIGKDEVEITIKSDFTGKVYGSLVENGNILNWADGGTYETRTPESMQYESVQVDIDRIAKLDGSTTSYRGLNKDADGKVCFKYDVIRLFTEALGEKFWSSLGASTISEKVNLMHSKVTKVTNRVWGYGSGPSGFKLSVGRYAYGNLNKVADITTSSANAVKEIASTTTYLKDKVNSTGFMNIMAFAEVSDGVTPSTLFLDYSNIEITIKISANEYILSLIAAYHRENEKYTFEKVGEV